MKRSIFFVIIAVIAILLGSTMLFIPGKMAEGFGVSSSPIMIFMMREIGLFNLGSGVLNYFVRNDKDSNTLKGVLIFNIAYHLIMVPLNLSGVFQGTFPIGQAIAPLVIHIFVGFGSLIYLMKIKAVVN